jgi:hypothetical protein
MIYTMDGISYDSETGVFIGKKGNILTSRNITFEGKQVLAHRLAYRLITGDWPTTYIDHIDRDKRNNKWSNLRLATPSDNNCNTSLRADNRSGVKGVCFKASRRKWLVQVSKDRRIHHCGYYDTLQEATQAAVEARRRLHGSFACD